MIVVFDTNVLISAFLYGGNPRELLRALVKKQLIAVTSLILVNELLGTLSYSFGFTHAELERIERFIQRHFIIVRPHFVPLVIKADPDDNHVLAAALAGHAEWIISGDRHLLELEKFHFVAIKSPAEMVNLHMNNYFLASLTHCVPSE